MLEMISRSKLSKRQGVHFHKKFGVDRAPQSVESVTKYSFAKFKEIFAKLRSKLSVCVVLTEKIVGTSSIFGLDRSATHFFTKIFRWDDLLCPRIPWNPLPCLSLERN